MLSVELKTASMISIWKHSCPFSVGTSTRFLGDAGLEISIKWLVQAKEINNDVVMANILKVKFLLLLFPVVGCSPSVPPPFLSLVVQGPPIDGG